MAFLVNEWAMHKWLIGLSIPVMLMLKTRTPESFHFLFWTLVFLRIFFHFLFLLYFLTRHADNVNLRSPSFSSPLCLKSDALYLSASLVCTFVYSHMHACALLMFLCQWVFLFTQSKHYLLSQRIVINLAYEHCTGWCL